MLVVEFFQQALRVRYDGGLHYLYFAIGVLIVGAVLYIGARKLSRE